MRALLLLMLLPSVALAGQIDDYQDIWSMDRTASALGSIYHQYCGEVTDNLPGEDFAPFFNKLFADVEANNWPEMDNYTRVAMDINGLVLHLDVLGLSTSIPNTAMHDRLWSIYPEDETKIIEIVPNPCLGELSIFCASIWNQRIREFHGLGGLPRMPGGAMFETGNARGICSNIVDDDGAVDSTMAGQLDDLMQVKRRKKDIEYLGQQSTKYLAQLRRMERAIALSGVRPDVVALGARGMDSPGATMQVRTTLVKGSLTDHWRAGLNQMEMNLAAASMQGPPLVDYTFADDSVIRAPMIAPAGEELRDSIQLMARYSDTLNESAMIGLKNFTHIPRRIALFSAKLPLRDSGFRVPIHDVAQFRAFLRAYNHLHPAIIPAREPTAELGELDNGLRHKVWRENGIPTQSRIPYYVQSDLREIVSWFFSGVFGDTYTPGWYALFPGLDSIASTLGQICEMGAAIGDASRAARDVAEPKKGVTILRNIFCDPVLKSMDVDKVVGKGMPMNSRDVVLQAASAADLARGSDSSFAQGIGRLVQVFQELKLSWAGFGAHYGVGPTSRSMARLGVCEVSPAAIMGVVLRFVTEGGLAAVPRCSALDSSARTSAFPQLQVLFSGGYNMLTARNRSGLQVHKRGVHFEIGKCATRCDVSEFAPVAAENLMQELQANMQLMASQKIDPASEALVANIGSQITQLQDRARTIANDETMDNIGLFQTPDRIRVVVVAQASEQADNHAVIIDVMRALE